MLSASKDTQSRRNTSKNKKCILPETRNRQSKNRKDAKQRRDISWRTTPKFMETSQDQECTIIRQVTGLEAAKVQNQSYLMPKR